MAEKFSNNTKMEKSLLEIWHIVYRGKIIIVFSTFLFLILAYLYNKFSTPVFESEALLKKENTQRERTSELFELIKLQTMDQVGTVMELLKSEDVMGRVIDELKLRVELKQIIDPSGNPYKLKPVFIDFPDSGNSYAKQIGFGLPLFKNVELKDNRTERELYVEKKGENLFELREVEENKLVLVSENIQDNVVDTLNGIFSTPTVDSIITSNQQSIGTIFNADFAQFEFSWNDAPVGSKVYFKFNNFFKLLEGISEAIYATKPGGSSSLFRLHVRYSSPFAAKVIAENVIRCFREARMEQQRQTVRYSFQFVEDQLTEVQKKLFVAENELSNFKASGEIITIDAQVTELTEYLSSLEAEKLKTVILLEDYKQKRTALIKELSKSEYFDQGFLEPTDNFQPNSPFAQLMYHLSTLELQKMELLQDRTESHPDVRAINEQIALTENKLTEYNQHTVNSLQIMINVLENKLLKIADLMSTYEERMRQLPAQENEMTRLLREKEVYEKIFKLLRDKREEMRVAELSQVQDIVVVDNPHEPISPIKPRKMMNMLIGLFVGGFMGILSVFLIELKNFRRINIDDLEKDFKIPILALIPSYDKHIKKRIKKAINIEDLFSALKGDNLGIRESFRLLETKLHQLNIRDKTILITSCEENTGKTSIVANLAITLAQNNKNVLVIDCDLRKANLSKMFDVFNNSPGLIDYINKGGTPEIYNKVLKHLSIIPAGGLTENSGLLLSSDRMKSLFNSFDTSVYDNIILDTPPVTRVVDTLALGQFIKNAILVVRPDISIRETVIGGIQEMTQARIIIRGIVGNAVEIQKSYHYKYRYGYGYGYSKGDNGKSPSRKKRSSIISKAFKINSN